MEFGGNQRDSESGILLRSEINKVSLDVFYNQKELIKKKLVLHSKRLALGSH